MASYLPPIPLVQDDFNSASFQDPQGALTFEEANKLFLRFPTAQGAENLADVNVSGNLTTTNDDTYGTVFGYQTSKPTTGASIHNTAYGYQSAGGLSNTTGTGGNSAFGALTMPSITGVAGNNTAIGYQSLRYLASGLRNTAVGAESGGVSLGTGADNICVGYGAITSGNNSFATVIGSNAKNSTDGVSVGGYAGGSIADGLRNIAIGTSAMYNLGNSISSGSDDNVCVGFLSGRNANGSTTAKNTAVGNWSFGGDTVVNTTGNSNVCVGYFAGGEITTASLNTIVGSDAGYTLTTGTSNSLMGYGAGGSITTALRNIAIGSEAIGTTAVAKTLTSGANDNVCIGYQSGQILSGAVATRNVALGTATLGGLLTTSNNTTGVDNTCIGHNAGGNLTTGSTNTIVGSTAGDVITTGSNNTLLGYNSGGQISTGGLNTLIGNNAGGAISTVSNTASVGYNSLLVATGANNTALGSNAGLGNLGGADNTYLGYQAGLTNTTGSNNTFIGAQADAGATDRTFMTVIGSQATSSTSNSITLGRANTDSVRLTKMTPIYTTTLPFIAGDIGFEYTGVLTANFGTNGSWMNVSLSTGVWFLSIFGSLTLTVANTQQPIEISMAGQTPVVLIDYLPGSITGNTTVLYTYSGIYRNNVASSQALTVKLLSAMTITSGAFNTTVPSYYSITRIA